MISSRSFRSGFFDGDRYRFFASCCVIVLAPRENDPRAQSTSSDCLQLLEVHALVLKKRIVFGDEDGALQLGGDVRCSGTQRWMCRGACPFARASARGAS